jgi:hypothetical protein
MGGRYIAVASCVSVEVAYEITLCSTERPNGLELSCPAEAGNPPLLYGTLAGRASSNHAPARRVSFSELLGRAQTAESS